MRPGVARRDAKKPRQRSSPQCPTAPSISAQIKNLKVRMTTWRELTFPIDCRQEEVLVIVDDQAIIINDPLRWRILEILGEGNTVAEISELLDVTDAGARILYHLQRLAETGVVHLEEDGSSAPVNSPRPPTYRPRLSSRCDWRCLPALSVSQLLFLALKIRSRRRSIDGLSSSDPLPTTINNNSMYGFPPPRDNTDFFFRLSVAERAMFSGVSANGCTSFRPASWLGWPYDYPGGDIHHGRCDELRPMMVFL